MCFKISKWIPESVFVFRDHNKKIPKIHRKTTYEKIIFFKVGGLLLSFTKKLTESNVLQSQPATYQKRDSGAVVFL